MIQRISDSAIQRFSESANSAICYSLLSMVPRFVALVAAAPDAPALIDSSSGVVTTRGTLRAHGQALAARLEAAGVREGDAVAIQLPNSAEFVAAFLAALQL